MCLQTRFLEEQLELSLLILTISSSTPRPTTVPKSPRKPYCQRKRSTSVEDDISDIIEILSSPVRSPFIEDIVKISSDSFSCSSRKRIKTQKITASIPRKHFYNTRLLF
jgi:hypothetical protein